MKSVPSISVTYAQKGTSTAANELGMRPMQERAYKKRGEQYLLIKAPPASGKSRALNLDPNGRITAQPRAMIMVRTAIRRTNRMSA